MSKRTRATTGRRLVIGNVGVGAISAPSLQGQEAEPARDSAWAVDRPLLLVGVVLCVFAPAAVGAQEPDSISVPGLVQDSSAVGNQQSFDVLFVIASTVRRPSA